MNDIEYKGEKEYKDAKATTMSAWTDIGFELSESVNEFDMGGTPISGSTWAVYEARRVEVAHWGPWAFDEWFLTPSIPIVYRRWVREDLPSLKD